MAASSGDNPLRCRCVDAHDALGGRSKRESLYLYGYPFCIDVVRIFTGQCGNVSTCELHAPDEMEVKEDGGMLSIYVFGQFET